MFDVEFLRKLLGLPTLAWREIPASLPEPKRNPLIGELSEASSRSSNSTGRFGRGRIKGDRRAAYGGPCRDRGSESPLLHRRPNSRPSFPCYSARRQPPRAKSR